MSEPTENPVEGTPAPSTLAGSLDMADRKDRGLLRQAARRRWPVPDDMKQRSVNKLSVALDGADDADKIVDIVRTIAVLEGQNQDDEHLAEKHGRIDLGKATEHVTGFEGVKIIVPGITPPATQ